jgi:Domain of unknown function (DUF3597)
MLVAEGDGDDVGPLTRHEEHTMSIFDTLKHAIFGARSQPQTAATGGTAQPPPAAAPVMKSSDVGSTSTASSGPVDVEAVLTEMATAKHEKLNWQSSIVDLMKLVDLDPSLDNRKTLANELGYTGDTQDSAKMNIWLHRQVMQRLAATGGKVPESLRH